jgi:hypothetical protein
MSVYTISTLALMKPEQHFITLAKGMNGHFACEFWINPEGNFPEPWETGYGRYETQKEAMTEALQWAADSNLPFVL